MELIQQAIDGWTQAAPFSQFTSVLDEIEKALEKRKDPKPAY